MTQQKADITTLLTGLVFSALRASAANIDESVTFLAVEPSGEIRMRLASGRVATVTVSVNPEPESEESFVGDASAVVLLPEATA